MTKDSRKRKRDEVVKELPDVDSGDEQVPIDDDALKLVPATEEESTNTQKQKLDKKSKKPQNEDKKKNDTKKDDKSRRQKNIEKYEKRERPNSNKTDDKDTPVEDDSAPKKTAARFIVFMGNQFQILCAYKDTHSKIR